MDSPLAFSAWYDFCCSLRSLRKDRTRDLTKLPPTPRDRIMCTVLSKLIWVGVMYFVVLIDPRIPFSRNEPSMLNGSLDFNCDPFGIVWLCGPELFVVSIVMSWQICKTWDIHICVSQKFKSGQYCDIWVLRYTKARKMKVPELLCKPFRGLP